MAVMKTATLPALRVSPELRQAAEKALRPDETLSGLMETSLKNFIAQRRAQDDFIARGLLARDEAKRTGDYVSVDEVMGKLRAMTAAAKEKQRAAADKPKSRKRVEPAAER